MKLLVVDNGTSYLPLLLRLIVPHEVNVIPWEQFKKPYGTSCDAVILSGGHSLTVMHHDQAFKEELGFIRAASKPIVGICLGFELIAHAYSASLRKLEQKEKGLVTLSVVQPHQIFLGIPEANVYESHRWVVTSLQKPLIGLACSKDGYEVIMHESKPIFGFQFHPELFPESTVGDEIMKNCLAFIQEQRSAK